MTAADPLIEPVYISGTCMLPPLFFAAEARRNGGAHTPHPSGATTTELRGLRQRRWDYDVAHPSLPVGREARTLRRDVALALISAGRLLAERGLSAEAAAETGLFLATGLAQDPALEQQIQILCEAYVAPGARSEAQRNGALLRMLPPLMPLSGLSNSAACYLAQRLGIRGDNAVFGVTSHAGFSAARTAMRYLSSGGERALVGGANAVGYVSALAFGGLGSGEFWEAEGAAFVLLETGSSLARDGRRPLCRVARMTELPFRGKQPTPCPEPLPLGVAEDWRLVYGGTAFRSQHDAAMTALAAAGHQPVSWFSEVGSLGAATVAAHVGAAALLVAERGVPAACLNLDEYGRESMIRLVPCDWPASP